MTTLFYKDPDAILDFPIDWASWLDTDTISTSAWTVEAGLTKVTDTNTTTTTTIWLSGGTVNTAYTVTNRIVTAGGRTNDRIAMIVCRVQPPTFSYLGDLSTDRDKVRFYIADTTEDGGPRPADANYSDAEIDALVTAEGTWQRAVGVMLDVLATEWSQHADITVGPRRQSFSQVADAYAKRAAKWRKDNNIYPGIYVAGVIRVDGYSDDVASNDVDATTEYARVTIRTWEYPL